jgi:hypothetical protein
MEMLRRGRRGSFAAFALAWALSPAHSQLPADLPAAAAPGSETAAAAAGTMVPTNVPGVYAFTQAPPGFDPGSAAPEDLARYGYPPRPAAAEGAEVLAAWRMATKPSLERVVPALLRTNHHHQPIAAGAVDAVSGAIGSINWSGYALLGDPGSPGFYSVLGHWTIPTAQQRFGSCSGDPDYSAQWVGIDGFINHYLVQSGSEADAYCDAGRQVGRYYPWLAWLPGSELVIYKSLRPLEPLPFYPGDYLMVEVWATNWVNGASQTGHVLFTDLTRNWQGSLSFSAASAGGTKVFGRSAEWIVERPVVNNRLARLANYTANPWTLVFARDRSRRVHTPAAPGAATAHNIAMVDEAGALLSYVELYGNSALWFYNEGSSR